MLLVATVEVMGVLTVLKAREKFPAALAGVVLAFPGELVAVVVVLVAVVLAFPAALVAMVVMLVAVVLAFPAALVMTEAVVVLHQFVAAF